MNRRRAAIFLLAALALLAAPPPARAQTVEPPLRVVAGVYAQQLGPGDRFQVVISVFSTAPTTTTTTLGMPLPDELRQELRVVSARASVGTAGLLAPPFAAEPQMAWIGSAWQDHPATIWLILEVTEGADPLGHWQEFAFSARDDRGETAQAAAGVYIGRGPIVSVDERTIARFPLIRR